MTGRCSTCQAVLVWNHRERPARPRMPEAGMPRRCQEDDVSDTLAITPIEQRQLDAITRRLDQVAPVLDAIHRATRHLPAADRLHVQQRLHELAVGTSDTAGAPLAAVKEA